MKTETIAWSDFPWQPEQLPSKNRNVNALIPLAGTAAVLLVIVLTSGHASAEAVPAMANQPTIYAPAKGGGWEAAKGSILHILDYVSYGVIVFSGGSWMFGHRNKALDLLLSCGIGTVIIRHADDIENFFKSI